MQIIAARPRAGRRTSSRRGGAKSQVLGASNSPATRARAAPAAPAAKVAVTSQASEKIIVSNLPPDVNEAQIRVCCLRFSLSAVLLIATSQELFTQTVGPLRDVNLHFDAKGVSKGVAWVQFSRKGDGNKAYTQYNNRLIDGS